MVAVALSGVIGRFIYLQIPKTIEGKAMSLNEIEEYKSGIKDKLIKDYAISDRFLEILEADSSSDTSRLAAIKKHLKESQLSKKDRNNIIKLSKSEIKINKRIRRLELMQKLFEYWHVVHLPFAIMMIVIMIVHVGVTILFGYRWIF
jgi:ribosomal protein S15P/S13E